MGDVNENESLYGFAGNNPIILNDPYGLLSDTAHPQELHSVTVRAVKNSSKKVGSFHMIGGSYGNNQDNTRVALAANPDLFNSNSVPGYVANRGLSQPAYPAKSLVNRFVTTRT